MLSLLLARRPGTPCLTIREIWVSPETASADFWKQHWRFYGNALHKSTTYLLIHVGVYEGSRVVKITLCEIKLGFFANLRLSDNMVLFRVFNMVVPCCKIYFQTCTKYNLDFDSEDSKFLRNFCDFCPYDRVLSICMTTVYCRIYRSLTGEFSLASARSAADVWPLMWV